MNQELTTQATKKNHSWRRLVLILVLVGVFLFLAVALPAFIKARSQTARNACLNNIRQIEAAREQWARETVITNLSLQKR